MAQLSLNLCGIVFAGITTLYVERRLFERRRRRHLEDGTRAAAGLPAERS
jgi:hypothetical protein